MKESMFGKIYSDNSWDFRNANTKQTSQGFHSYPAMMIPQIANRLIKEYGKNGGVLLDPFAGSGSSLVEARISGMNAYGIDINPLARLISSVKTTTLNIKLLKKVEIIIKSDLKTFLSDQETIQTKQDIPTFKNIDYWFKKNVLNDLSIIKNYLLDNYEDEMLQFLFIVFSETVRECSNTRNGEFKLYRMPANKLETFNPNVFDIFEKIFDRNYVGMIEFVEKCDCKTWVKVLDEDSRNTTSISNNSIDLVVTSPPYGDSRTTVAYGQYSRLSLQWLELYKNDVDKISLGGMKKKKYSWKNTSGLLKKTIDIISKEDSKRALEVLGFYVDIDKCFKEISRVMKKNAKMCMVVGNRTVKGIQIPTDKILVEMMDSYGFIHKETIIRNIPNKRMPSKNSPSNKKGQLGRTMTKEYIIISDKK